MGLLEEEPVLLTAKVIAPAPLGGGVETKMVFLCVALEPWFADQSGFELPRPTMLGLKTLATAAQLVFCADVLLLGMYMSVGIPEARDFGSPRAEVTV